MQKNHEVAHEGGMCEDSKPNGSCELNDRRLVNFREFFEGFALLFGLRLNLGLTKDRAVGKRDCINEKKSVDCEKRRTDNFYDEEKTTKAH